MDQKFHPVELLTVAEIAGALRVSKMTVYRKVHSGELPSVQFGRSFRIPATAVEAYMPEASGSHPKGTAD
ncbi:helix-turn-helix domain-containing protein [Arthrobacter sp. H14]|uniref:helix-turn-helix domain-containing protein n=1 Tax=Arthrobacter sp. H14 TaxID=1312959 RepID=UPI0004B8237E|nr:helix-turn-helix domain-containing protein [Arthrobacter sp. H14]